MATITHSAKNKTVQMPARKVFLTGICLSSIFNSGVVLADFNFQAGVGAEAIQQEVKSPGTDRRSLTTYTVEPTVTGSYQSKTLSGAWTGNVTYIERDREDASQEDTFAEYSYNGQWMPFERLLIFQASGAVNYQNATAGNYLVTDFINNPQNLAKARSNRYSATLQLDQGNYIRAQGLVAYSNVESERSRIGNQTRLDNDTYQATGSLRNGENATHLFWNLDGSYQETEGENPRTTRGDFITRRASTNVDFIVIGDWGIRATATHEANQISNRNDSGSRVRQFETYGAGLIYRQSAARYIAITANRSESDLDSQEDEDFIGGELRWAFSSRSQISASYGRRFYGDSASASFEYNTKNIRASFEYDEDVTNTSRLLADPQNLGVFVCPVTSTAFSDCFQPASLSYQPGADEQLVELIVPNLEFDDNIILRRSGNAQVGYSFSRISVGLSLRYSEDDYLDTNRLRQTYATGLNFSYLLGNYTRLNAQVNYAEIEQRATDFESGSSDNISSSIGLSREIGRYLSVDLELSYLQKDGDLTAGSVFGPEYTDRRISIGLRYQFN